MAKGGPAKEKDGLPRGCFAKKHNRFTHTLAMQGIRGEERASEP